MISFGHDYAGVCIVSILMLTLAGIFLVTIWSFGPDRYKQARNRHNDLHIEM